MKFSFMVLAVLLILSSCDSSKDNDKQEVSTGNVTAEEILTNHPAADIFQFDGIVYSNASKIEWVQEEDLTPGKLVGTISKKYNKDFRFEEGMATQLPIGTEIYVSDPRRGPILIVKVNDAYMRYLGLIEG